MTRQVKDTISIGNKIYPICRELPFPKDHPRIITLRDEEASQSCDSYRSMGLIRGYVAHYKLDQNRLMLLSLEGKFRLEGDEPLNANWCRATLPVPVGQYKGAHEFDEFYDEWVHYVVEWGVFIKRIEVRCLGEGVGPRWCGF